MNTDGILGEDGRATAACVLLRLTSEVFPGRCTVSQSTLLADAKWLLRNSTVVKISHVKGISVRIGSQTGCGQTSHSVELIDSFPPDLVNLALADSRVTLMAIK